MNVVGASTTVLPSVSARKGNTCHVHDIIGRPKQQSPSIAAGEQEARGTLSPGTHIHDIEHQKAQSCDSSLQVTRQTYFAQICPCLTALHFKIISRPRVHHHKQLRALSCHSTHNATDPNLQARAHQGRRHHAADRLGRRPSTNTHLTLRTRHNNHLVLVTACAPARRAPNPYCDRSRAL